MFTLQGMMLTILLYQVPNDLFPSEAIMIRAQQDLQRSRTMMSDYPELYRTRWSGAVDGPCPEVLNGPGLPEEWEVPCSIYRFTPNPNELLPSVLHLGYRNLVYTPPKSKSTTKASLSISWEYTIISAGIIWKLTINAEGIKHDIWYCEYQVYQREIEIAPFVYIDVEILRPSRYYHVTVNPTENYNIQTHTIREWETPMSAMDLGLIYDVQLDQPSCGTPTYTYTTKPAETLMEVFGALVPDVGEIVQGDRQVIRSPVLGYRDCGEYSFPGFYRMMTHRPPPGPAIYAEGPPVEIWSFQGERDNSESTAQVLDPDAEISHSRVSSIRETLQEEGLSGPIVSDENLSRAINEQEALEDQRFKSGRDMTDAALSLIALLQANPENEHLWELYEQFVAPNIDHMDRINDTEIEFNPFQTHCTREGALGHIPILGEHYFEEVENCDFCHFHERIVHQPRHGWSHSRLTFVDWIWSPIHGVDGNIREKAHAFIQQVMFPSAQPQARETLTDLQNRLGARQRDNAHQGQIETLTVGDLEGVPSDTTENTTASEAADTLPRIFRDPFDRCTDPSWTIEFMSLYGEISDIFAAPCGLLWGVAG